MISDELKKEVDLSRICSLDANDFIFRDYSIVFYEYEHYEHYEHTFLPIKAKNYNLRRMWSACPVDSHGLSYSCIVGPDQNKEEELYKLCHKIAK
jgi:hypothetical protein